jgi:Protein of unknown function (DUF732)
MNNDPMAERGRSGDETVAAQNVDATALGKTAGVPNRAPTESVELAWSEGSESYEGDFGGDFGGGPKDDRRSASAPVGQSWGATVQRAAALFGICLVVAGAIVFAHWLLTSPKSPEKAAAPSAAAPTTSISTLPPVQVTSTKDQDNAFMQALKDKGIDGLPRQVAIDDGKTVCKNIAQGGSRQDVTSEFVAQSQFPGNADDFVATAIHSYCPQYNNVVGGN